MDQREVTSKAYQKKPLFTEILRKVLDLDTTILFSIPSMIGVVVGLLGIRIGKYYFDGTFPKEFILLNVSIIFLCWGLSGVVLIYKRELPGRFFTIRGIIVVIFGILWTLGFWLLSIIAIWSLITQYL